MKLKELLEIIQEDITSVEQLASKYVEEQGKLEQAILDIDADIEKQQKLFSEKQELYQSLEEDRPDVQREHQELMSIEHTLQTMMIKKDELKLKLTISLEQIKELEEVKGILLEEQLSVRKVVHEDTSINPEDLPVKIVAGVLKKRQGIILGKSLEWLKTILEYKEGIQRQMKEMLSIQESRVTSLQIELETVANEKESLELDLTTKMVSLQQQVNTLEEANAVALEQLGIAQEGLRGEQARILELEAELRTKEQELIKEKDTNLRREESEQARKAEEARRSRLEELTRRDTMAATVGIGSYSSRFGGYMMPMPSVDRHFEPRREEDTCNTATSSAANAEFYSMGTSSSVPSHYGHGYPISSYQGGRRPIMGRIQRAGEGSSGSDDEVVVHESETTRKLREQKMRLAELSKPRAKEVVAKETAQQSPSTTETTLSRPVAGVLSSSALSSVMFGGPSRVPEAKFPSAKPKATTPAVVEGRHEEHPDENTPKPAARPGLKGFK
jgi:hypothetical protein